MFKGALIGLCLLTVYFLSLNSLAGEPNLSSETRERLDVCRAYTTPYTLARRYYLGVVDELREKHQVTLDVKGDGSEVWYFINWGSKKASVYIIDRGGLLAPAIGYPMGDIVPAQGFYTDWSK